MGFPYLFTPTIYLLSTLTLNALYWLYCNKKIKEVSNPHFKAKPREKLSLSVPSVHGVLVALHNPAERKWKLC